MLQLSYCNPRAYLWHQRRGGLIKQTGAPATPEGFWVTLLFNYQRSYQKPEVRGQKTESCASCSAFTRSCENPGDNSYITDLVRHVHYQLATVQIPGTDDRKNMFFRRVRYHPAALA